MTSVEAKPDYGIDAPGVIRNLFLAALIVFMGAILFPSIRVGPVIFITRPMAWTAAPSLALGGVLMLIYAEMEQIPPSRSNPVAHLLDRPGNCAGCRYPDAGC